MISKAELNNLIGDYQSAYQMALQVANIVKSNEKTALEILGRWGPTGATRLVTDTSDAAVHLWNAIQQLLEKRDDPKLYPPT